MSRCRPPAYKGLGTGHERQFTSRLGLLLRSAPTDCRTSMRRGLRWVPKAIGWLGSATWRSRLRQEGTEWYRWGPYVSERQWGTVREDYSADGNAWDNLPHDQARSRAYRWGEDGLAGFCDVEQRLCLGLALWNGKDPILKERPFGLTGPQGNHGEDVKEYWWYLDALPSHAWNRWRYHCRRARSRPGPDRHHARPAGMSPRTNCWTPARSTRTGTGSPRCTTPRPARMTC